MTRGRAARHLGGLAAGTTLALALGSREVALGAVVVYFVDVTRDAWREARGHVDGALAELEETSGRE